MSIVGTFRTLAAAALAASATFTANAAEVISVNFSDGAGGGEFDENRTYSIISGVLPDGVIGSAWNIVSGENAAVNQTVTLEKVSVDGVVANSGNVSLNYSARNFYHNNNGADDASDGTLGTRNYPYFKSYLDDGDHDGVVGATLKFSNIPYARYDVIVYLSNDHNGVAICPVKVNGVSYTYDSQSNKAVPGSSNWGRTQIEMEVGQNVLIVEGIQTSELTVQADAANRVLADAANGGVRCGIGAVQIVKRDTMPNLNFTYGPNPANNSTGWFEAFGDANGKNRMIGPEGMDVYYNNGNPYHNCSPFSEVTVAAIVNLDNLKPATDKSGVVWSIGSMTRRNSSYSFILAKRNGDLYLHAARRTSDGSVWADPYSSNDDGYAYCRFPNLGRGYHLIIATYSVADNTLKLRVDNNTTIVSGPNDHSQSLHALGRYDTDNGDAYLGGTDDCGMQLGSIFHDCPDPFANGTGIAFDRILGWEQALSEEQIGTLWNLYAAVIQNPLAVSYETAYETENGVRYVPDATFTDMRLMVNEGTIKIPEGTTVSAASVWLGNSSLISKVYGMDVDGVLNITSDTRYQIWHGNGEQDAEHSPGVLLGHWAGHGTINVTGTLAATNAFIQTTHTVSDVNFNINGGTVTARGLFANNGDNSKITLSNGGTLEIADFHSGSAIPLTSVGGTIRAVESGTYNSGWTWNGTVAVNGATTIDPNGKAVVFSGVASGTGAITIADSSANGAGSVKFASASALRGDIAVNAGTLDLGVSRPSGTITFAQGAKLVLVESLADGNNRIALKIAGDLAAENVTLSRDDGTAYGGTLTVETDAETGFKYIAFKTNTNPAVSGTACWYDFEFENSSYNSSGRVGGNLTKETQNGINRLEVVGNTDFFDPENTHAGLALYTAAESWMDVTYPDSWAAAVYATIPQQTNAVLMTFGTNGGGFIGLICGDPEKNEVKLVRTTGNSKYSELATMTVPYAYTVPHLYVFSKSANKIEIYLDGKLVSPYTSQTEITFGSGFQIGSVHGTVGATGVKQFKAELVGGELPAIYTNSRIGMLRMYDSTLSPEASAKLAREFPYESPSDAFMRTLNGGTVSWTAEDAWEKGGETEKYSAPTENSVVELTANADTTVTLDSAVALESLTVKGPGKVTFVSQNGATLAVSGATTLETDTVLPHTATIGTVDLGDNTLTLDYTGYDIALNAPNGSFVATGLVSGNGTVTIIPPSNPKGREFTVTKNAENGQWYINYSRGAYTLYWGGTAATGNWSALDVWKKDYAQGEAAAFLEGDSVVFGNVENVGAVTVTIPQAVTVGGITIDAANTTYTLNGTINVDGANITVASDAAITGLAGTAGTVNITGSNVTLGSSGALAIATAATVSANTALTIDGGNGTITYTGGGTAFQGTLEVKQGTFVVDCQFNNVTATEANPIKVTETGHLFFRAETNASGDRLAANGFITVDGANAFLEVEGNNTFPRRNSSGPDGLTTVICRNGGVFQVNGVDQWYNIHVKDVILESGIVRLSGTVASWGPNRGLEIDGKLVSTGESYLTRTSGAVDRLVLAQNTVEVQSGTLHWELMAQDSAIIKAGAGALVFGGTNGGTYNGVGTVTVSEGTLVANDRLKGAAKNLVFERGTTLDISGVTDDYDLSGFTSVTLNGRVKLDLGERAVAAGDKVLAWTTVPSSGRFAATTASGISFAVQKLDDGAYLAVGGFSLIFR